MKKLLIIAATAALVSASANAADMAARPYTKAPPAIAAVYDWSGFYLGANAGYASSRNCWNFESFAGAPFTAGEGCHNADGSRRRWTDWLSLAILRLRFRSGSSRQLGGPQRFERLHAGLRLRAW